jgi:hypothetical protein
VITGEDLLESIERAFPGGVTRHFRYPFIITEVQSSDFAGLDDDEREQLFAQRVGHSEPELGRSLNRLFIRTQLRAPTDAVATRPDEGRFWLRLLAEPGLVAPQPQPKPAVPTVHFYGYKGGQARSTMLAFLSSVLATDGWRVLVIDADAEAPSADIIFRANVVSPEATLVGLRAGLGLEPLRVFSHSERGFVDLLAFRSADTRYDLDAAALALEQALSPATAERMAKAVEAFAASRYDLVLIDHRTGLSPAVLPWVAVLAGPIVVFARLDEQWRPARPHLRALWRTAGEDPGVIVSFKNDSDPLPRYRSRVLPQAEALLDDLAEATATKGNLPEEYTLSGQQISDHWVVWPYDSAFVNGSVPSTKEVGGQVLESVSQLRRLLGLGALLSNPPAVLHRSGARDEGDLIQTAALRTLMAPNNHLFVLGRKGTGKTRLVRALADADVGEPLLVADDFSTSEGIRANLAELKVYASELRDEPVRLWWMLFTAALELGTTDRTQLEHQLAVLSGLPLGALVQRARNAPASNKPRLFLLDGLETAFDQNQIINYIAALVQFISTVDGDDDWRSRARLQVYLRTDLALKGYENFEQLSQGRTLKLEWDAQAIMNFVLSRIVALEWFQKNFPLAIQKIRDVYPNVKVGAVEIGDAEALLLEIFPEKLRRLNLKMTTFMRTYFSDDPSGMTSFYPRIYDQFLLFIAENGTKKSQNDGLEGPLHDGRVSQQLIYAAHEKATEDFLGQVRSELRYLVTLDDTTLDRLLTALRGTATPFRLEIRIREIAQQTNISVEDVRAAFDQMLNIGVFEIREGYRGQWRVGRLFKSSLGMLYARGDKSPDRV